MDPRTRLLLLGIAGVWSVLLDTPVTLLGLTLLCAIPFWASVSPTWRWRGLGVAAAVVWTTTLGQGLFYADLPRTPLLQVGPVVVWWEGVRWGLVQSLRLVSVAWLGIAVVAATPQDRLLLALRSLRVPWSLGLLALTALRFVPQVGAEWQVARRARRRRGVNTGWVGSPRWLRGELRLLTPVAARSLRRARRVAETLDARGFDPLAQRTVRRPLRFAAWEPVLLGAVGLLTLAALVAEALFGLYVSDLFYDPRLRPLYGMVRAWM